MTTPRTSYQHQSHKHLSLFSGFIVNKVGRACFQMRWPDRWWDKRKGKWTVWEIRAFFMIRTWWRWKKFQPIITQTKLRRMQFDILFQMDVPNTVLLLWLFLLGSSAKIYLKTGIWCLIWCAFRGVDGISYQKIMDDKMGSNRLGGVYHTVNNDILHTNLTIYISEHPYIDMYMLSCRVLMLLPAPSSGSRPVSGSSPHTTK